MNKVRWREHELLLVTVVSILGIAGYVWRIFDLSPESLDFIYGEPFINNGLSFSYGKNILLPHVGSILLLYLCYLRMNLFILPRLFQAEAKEKGTFDLHFSLAGRIEMKGPAGESLKRVLQSLLYTFLLFLLLGAGLGIAQYYQEKWAYFLPGNRDESRQIILGLGLKKAFVLMAVYVFYASLREASIRGLEKNDGRRSFRLSIANQVSGFLVIYISIAYFFYSFYIARDYGFYAFYFGIIAPILLVTVCNLYWIFPLKGDRSIFKRPVFGKLLFSTLVCTAPFTLVVNPKFSPLVPLILFGWTLQLVVTTPLSWLIYRLRRDKILQLRGLAIDYLLKPFSQARLLKACNKAYELYELKGKGAVEGSGFIFVKSGYGQIRLELSDILYVQSTGNYMQFVLTGEKVLSRLTMNEVEDLLPAAAFTRIHRSYIVARAKVTRMERGSVWVKDKEIPIGAGYAPEAGKIFL